MAAADTTEAGSPPGTAVKEGDGMVVGEVGEEEEEEEEEVAAAQESNEQVSPWCQNFG